MWRRLLTWIEKVALLKNARRLSLVLNLATPRIVAYYPYISVFLNVWLTTHQWGVAIFWWGVCLHNLIVDELRVCIIEVRIKRFNQKE